MIEKILLISALIFAVVAMLMGAGLSVQTSRIASLQKTLAAADKDNVACRESVSKQNAMIEAYQIDLEAAKQNVHAQTLRISEYAEREKAKVVERLIKDRADNAFPADGKELRACENRLNIIQEQLETFYVDN
jgi:arginine deiminase